MSFFNVGNLPLTPITDIEAIKINYGLYKNSRIVIKSNDDIIKDIGVTNNK
jgi:hypothetical protein